MTKPTNMPQLPRRDFLKAGGALVVGFSLLGGRAFAQSSKRVETAGPPDPKQIDTWLAIHAGNTATLYIGFVELGQGCTTSLPQVAAEELDLDMGQISTVQVDTNVTPNQGGTYSSSSTARGAPQIRTAAAEARQALLKLASEKLGAPVGMLTVAGGVVSVVGSKGKSVSYGDLVGGKRFDVAFTGTAPVKSPKDYRLVGTPVPRADIAEKARGTFTFIQHLTLPGMLHARIVRPRGQRAYAAGAKVKGVVADSIADIPGAGVVRKGDFLAVIAEKEWDAVRAADQLKVYWEDDHSLPGSDGLYAQMRAEKTEDHEVKTVGDVAKAFEGATHVASIACNLPYQSHASFAPNCALAHVTEDQALVICSTQDNYRLRMGLAPILGLPETQIRVQYCESSGTYGHSCHDDAAQAAAIVSQLTGKPIRLQFMRWDEHGWDLYGPGHVGEARVAADEKGKIVAYEYHGWSHHWSLIETSDQLANGTKIAEWPFGISQDVNPLVCGGQYAIPNVSLINHRVPGGNYLRGAWLRSPLDLSFAFTSEQAIDDLAHQLGHDPYEFRRNNIANERWLGVLDGAAKAANWTPRPAASKLSNAEIVTGRGIGLGTHLASWGGAVAELEVNRKTGTVRVLHLYGAIDAGLVVNPGNVEAQIMGQLVQTASRMLFEEVTFDRTGVTSLDWNSYPVIRFEDCPEVTPVVVQRLNEKYSGAGEETMAAAAAAVGNAFFDATGKRMKTFPFTPDRVLEALSA